MSIPLSNSAMSHSTKVQIGAAMCVFRRQKQNDFGYFVSEKIIQLMKARVTINVLQPQNLQLTKLQTQVGYLRPALEKIATQIQLRDFRACLLYSHKLRLTFSRRCSAVSKYALHPHTVQEHNSQLLQLSKKPPNFVKADFLDNFPAELNGCVSSRPRAGTISTSRWV